MMDTYQHNFPKGGVLGCKIFSYKELVATLLQRTLKPCQAKVSKSSVGEKSSVAGKRENYYIGLFFPLQTPIAHFTYGMECLHNTYRTYRVHFLNLVGFHFHKYQRIQSVEMLTVNKRRILELEIMEFTGYFHCLQSYCISISTLNIDSGLMLNRDSTPVP